MAAPEDFRTLQFGPLWVLSAITGRTAQFTAYERDAFFDVVQDRWAQCTGLARTVLQTVLAGRDDLLLSFELEDRPVVSGLSAVVRALADQPPADAWSYREVLLRVGADLARARGPYGRVIPLEHQQLLLLIAELLDLDSESPELGPVLV